MIVIPSGPGAPRFAFTCFQARSILAGSTTASIRDISSENKLKAGCSTCAVAVRSGRDNELVVSSDEEWFPRSESIDAPPCHSSFGPSRLDWFSRVGTMTSADSCSARVGFRQPVPSFQAALLIGARRHACRLCRSPRIRA